MNGFEYQYHTPSYILENILLLSEINPINLGLFGVVFLGVFVSQMYIIPAINILIVYSVKKRESNKRRSFIKQIAIQKDLEDQISAEIDAH